jgi:hypothetical protein
MLKQSVIFFFLFSFSVFSQKAKFQTWNSRSACAWVEPETGLQLQIHFKKVHRNQEKVLSEVRIGAREKEAEVVRPMGHSSDGSYTELEMDWENENLIIESAQEKSSGLLALRIIRKSKNQLPLRMMLSMNYIWQKKGNVLDNEIFLQSGNWKAGSFGKPATDFSVPAVGPNLLIEASDTSYFWLNPVSERAPKTNELNQLILNSKSEYYQGFNLNDELDLSRFAIQSCMAWNTIYDPGKNRVLHTVNRIWSVNRGGYVIFCWDNLLGSLLSWYGLKDSNLAISSFKAVLEDAAPDGFPTNNSQGNGRKALDRSQPPLGGIVALELYKQTKNQAFIHSIFPALYKWNRWWLKARMNGNLLSWGSHKSPNPFADPANHSLLGAKLESGLDDSPMFDSARFDPTNGLMMMHDVGLNSLYLADCESLSEIAALCGKSFLMEKKELDHNITYFKKELQSLYNPKTGFFQNQYLPKKSKSKIISPTLLYPLLTSAVSKKQIQEMIDSLLLQNERLGGYPGLPSIARNHPDFGKQRYWKGSVWPPLNYLVFKGLMKQNRFKEAQILADQSFSLFMNEYKRAKVICENYSGMNGRCDDPLVNSEPYYFWGGLLALMKAEMVQVTK